MTVEDDLRRALTQEASGIDAPDRWDDVESRVAAHRRRRKVWVGGLGGVGLVAAVIAGLLFLPGLVRRSPSRLSTTGSGTPATVPSLPTTAAPVQPSTTVAAPPPAPTTTPAQPNGPTFDAAGYQPLWPFADVAEARRWQAAYRSGGTQPWHLDAGQTALGFTQGYLGYAGIDRVVGSTVGATDAQIGVGFETEGGRTSTAAVIHLVRLGAGSAQEVGWEVVGTNDTADLTIETPAYGASVGSPVAVGGAVNGVDESIAVEVHQLSSDGPIGRQCCLPAGNSGVPWHTSVSFAGAHDRVLTISASTGGHIQAVERFAVTAVRVR
jgi:hypothetical protein